MPFVAADNLLKPCGRFACGRPVTGFIRSLFCDFGLQFMYGFPEFRRKVFDLFRRNIFEGFELRHYLFCLFTLFQLATKRQVVKSVSLEVIHVPCSEVVCARDAFGELQLSGVWVDKGELLVDTGYFG